MEELLQNAQEFLDSGNENLKKQRWNVAVADYFKAIVILCDYLIYREMKIKPKNHTDRFSLLKRYFSTLYKEISELFDIYTRSYALRLTKNDAEILKAYADGLKNRIFHKKET